MKITTLIRGLEQLREAHGNCEVALPSDLMPDYDDRSECDIVDLIPIVDEADGKTRILIADESIVERQDEAAY